MIARANSSWLTITADLALILFLVTAQVADSQPAMLKRPVNPPLHTHDTSSALAVHQPAIGESVRNWLAATISDARQVATISVEYLPGNRASAVAEATRLLEEADEAGVPARLIVTPSTVNSTSIFVDYLRDGDNGTNLAP